MATASKYGLVFVGSPKGVQCEIIFVLLIVKHNNSVYNDLFQCLGFNSGSIVDLQKSRSNNRGHISDYQRREIFLGVRPSHLDISSDNELLAVTFLIQNCPVLYVYSVTSFGSKVSTYFKKKLAKQYKLNSFVN